MAEPYPPSHPSSQNPPPPPRLRKLTAITDQMAPDGQFKLCCAFWVGLLLAGLWPFNFLPANEVHWLEDGNGIRFHGHGQTYASIPWNETRANAATDGAFSVELWLASEKNCGCVSTILTLDDPSQRKSFQIEQSIADLVVRGHFRDASNSPGFRSLWLDESLQKDKVRFLSVTSGPQGTALYLEGVRSRMYPFTPLADNLRGQLLLGHSAAGKSAWAGTIFGVAIYDRALTADEVSAHYEAWSQKKSGELAAAPGMVGLYRFDERSGNLVHNRAGSMADLVIPKRFFTLRKRFLARSFSFKKSDVRDAAVNIAGFVPFGLLVCAYLRGAARRSKPGAVLLTVLLGAATSLLIELLQAYLPSRDSSLPDVINNILGTGLGAIVLPKLTKLAP